MLAAGAQAALVTTFSTLARTGDRVLIVGDSVTYQSRAPLKEEFLQHLPTLMIVDGLGSSEAGGQLSHVSAGSGATTGTFPISPGNHVLSDDLTRELQAGDPPAA